MSKKCKKECVKKASIGGQALIEGIMMRGPKMTAMAVRDPDGKIILEKWRTAAAPKAKLARLPVIRGVYNFINSMISGYKCLMRSAEISGLEEAEEELKREKQPKKAKKLAKKQKATEADTAAVKAAEASEMAADAVEEPNTSEDTVSAAIPANDSEKKSSDKKKKKDKESSPLVAGVMIIASVLGVALSVGLFIFLPIVAYDWFSLLLPEGVTGNDILNSLVKSVFEGVLRIVVLVAYMLLVSLMKDIRRTFMYHGAEHKTIFCYEHGKELTVENVRREGRFHPRCGTSFLILMLIVGIFVSFFIDPVFLLITKDPELLKTGAYPFIRFAFKLLLTPFIMGLGYELIKFAGRHDNLVTRIISAPGVWLQHITVLEPDDGMIECAIRAFVEVLPEEERSKYQAAEPAESEPPEGAETAITETSDNAEITATAASDNAENAVAEESESTEPEASSEEISKDSAESEG